MSTIQLHKHDLPEGLSFGSMVAVDTETMGLDPRRDRLCLVQLSAGDGTAHLVQIIPPALGGKGADCPNLKALLADPAVTKLFHFARFDIAALLQRAGRAHQPGDLHENRLETGAHLYRPPRAERSLPRSRRRGDLQAAADQRLGRAPS